jgi:hypothetical protein
LGFRLTPCSNECFGPRFGFTHRNAEGLDGSSDFPEKKGWTGTCEVSESQIAEKRTNPLVSLKDRQ